MIANARYSGSTGLSGLAQAGWISSSTGSWWARVGGMFGAATTLVAESVPGGFRAMALGSLQALSATGNMMGTLISLKIQPGAEGSRCSASSTWRTRVGASCSSSGSCRPCWPCRSCSFCANRRSGARQKPPRPPKEAAHRGSPLALLRHPRWRRNTAVGLGLGVAGMVGLGASDLLAGTGYLRLADHTAAKRRYRQSPGAHRHAARRSQSGGPPRARTFIARAHGPARRSPGCRPGAG